jgi:hypothetical protein
MAATIPTFLKIESKENETIQLQKEVKPQKSNNCCMGGPKDGNGTLP